MGLLDFFKPKPKICEMCGMNNAKDILVIPKLKGYATRRRLCRSHFFSEHKAAFLSFPGKMVIAHPILDKRYAVYSYYPLAEMEKYAYEEPDRIAAKEFLDMIPSDKDCAYFDEQASQKVMSEFGSHPADLDKTNIQFLNKEQAYRKIESTLFSFSTKNDFADGFTTPYDHEGIYVTSFL